MKSVTKEEAIEVEDLDLKFEERAKTFSEVREFLIHKSKYPKVPFPDDFEYDNKKLNPDRSVIPIEAHGNTVVIRLVIKDSFLTIRGNKVNFANIVDSRVVAIGEGVANIKVGTKVALYRDYVEHMQAKRFTYIDGCKRDLESVKKMLDKLTPDESNQLVKEGIDSTEVVSYLVINSVIDIAYTILE